MSDGDEWKGEKPLFGGMMSSFFGPVRPMTDEEKARNAKRVAEQNARGSAIAVTLVAFSPVARCTKCGSSKVRTYFCAGREDEHCEQRIPGEHMHRTCRCKHRWYEKPLDAERSEA